MQVFLKRSTFYFLLCGTLIMMVIMAKTGSPLKTATTTSGILNLEFAHSKQKADAVLAAWQALSDSRHDLVASAKLNTAFDFIFLLFYSLFLYSCCKQLGLMLPQKNIIAKWLSGIAIAALLAGFLDIIENFGMLRSLSGDTSDSIALVTAVASVIKWCLVVVILISIISGLLIKISANKKLPAQN